MAALRSTSAQKTSSGSLGEFVLRPLALRERALRGAHVEDDGRVRAVRLHLLVTPALFPASAIRCNLPVSGRGERLYIARHCSVSKERAAVRGRAGHVALAGILVRDDPARPRSPTLPRHVRTLVVGAGPAGIMAALAAAPAGDVLLVDSSALPRDKSCGGMLNEYAQEFLATFGRGSRGDHPLAALRELPL